MARVYVRDQNGIIGSIEENDPNAKNYTALSEEEIAHEKARQERGTVGQQAIAGVEGLARGASVGLSDLALSKVLGDEYRKGAQQRQEFNPITAGATEIGGAIAPAFFTGGASAEAGLAARAAGAARVAEEASTIGKVARFIPSNLIGEAGTFAERAAGRLVGEGAEGALARMGQRAVGLGARGAAEGGLYGAGSEVSRAALDDAPITAEKLLSGFSHGALYGGLAGAGLGAVGSLGGSAIERLAGPGGVRGAAEKVANRSALEALGVKGQDIERIAAKTGRSAEQVIAEAGPEILGYRFASGPLEGQKLFTAARKAEDFVDDLALARRETAQTIVDGIQGAERGGASIDLNGYLSRVDQELVGPLRASNSPTMRAQAAKLESELEILQERATNPSAAAPGLSELKVFAAELKNAFPERMAGPQQAARMLDQEIDQAVEKHFAAQGLDATGYTKAQKTLDALTEVEQVAKEAASKADKPTDAMGLAVALGGLLSGNIGGALMGSAGGLVTKFAKKLIADRGQSVLAVMADNVARMDGRIEAAAQVLAGAPRKAVTIAATHKAPSLDRFDSTSETVRAFQQDPQVAMAKLSKPVEAIAPLHPQLAAQMQSTLQGDYQYLATQLPQVLSRSSNSLTPQAEKGRVPKSQQAKFMQVVQALEDPGSVIEKIAQGELPQAQIDALKVRRPQIYQQMRSEVIKATSSAKSPMSFLERTRVSLAFDFNGDASLDPKTLQAIQSSNRSQPREPDQPATTKDSNKPKASPSNLDAKEAQSMILPSQKALGG